MFAIPTDLTSFFLWLREKTERAWAELPEGELPGWQKGTRWSGGLTDEQLSSAEAFFGHPFPPDFRLFLKTLHTTTRAWKRIRYRDTVGELFDAPGFHDWIHGREALRDAMAWPVEGVLFDVEHNGLWLSEWGAKPEQARERQSVVQREASNASPLIPVFGHRYLVAQPLESGNPVLSVHQSDIIIYGDDLRNYLLQELGDLINEPVDPPTRSIKPVRLWGGFG
jgi:hypothetical protein